MADARTTPQLTPPVSERDHVRGGADAPVTLVEYGDFECPFCGNAYQVIKALEREVGDDLRFVFRHFPVPQVHPYAQRAAEASEAASVQGRFWEMHDYLYEHQPSLSEADLSRHAAALGLDTARFDAEQRERVYAARVLEDVASGRGSGVEGTPTFFLNGVRHDDAWDLRTLRAAIEATR